jgi:ribose transport system substrate-binding protein
MTRGRRGITGRSRRLIVGGLASGAVLAAWAASAATGAGAPLATAAKQTCGQDATFKLDDPSGVVNTLPKVAQQQYGTWPYKVSPTPWVHFKGIKKPWKIGFISYPINSPWQQTALNEYKREFAQAKKMGLVKGSLITFVQPSASTATAEQQVAAVQQMVREGVNGIIISPLLTTPLGPAIDAAGKAHVPVVIQSNVIPNSKYVLNVWANNNSPADAGVSGIVKHGNVLIVRGVAGNTVEGAFQTAALADIKACPGLKVVGTVWGNWDSSVAKTAVLNFLTSHPGLKIDMVIQHGGMMPGIISAFQTAGVPVPPISDGDASGGDLSWWLAHKAKYHTVGTTFTGAMTAYTLLRVLFRTLAGDEPKLSDISFTPALITNGNLATYAQSGLALDSPLQPKGEITAWCSNTCLNRYFKHSGSPGNF